MSNDLQNILSFSDQEAYKQEENIEYLSIVGHDFSALDKDQWDKIISFLRASNLESVKALHFENNNFSINCLEYIEKVLLVSKYLRSVFFVFQAIGDEGVRVFAKCLRNNPSWQNFMLDSCQIGDKGIQILVQALLKNTKLVQMNLSNNCIGLNGAKELAVFLRANKHLQKLDFSGNPIGSKGAVLILKSLQENKRFENLILQVCQIDNKGAISLAQALRENMNLIELDLKGNFQIDNKYLKDIQSLISRNLFLASYKKQIKKIAAQCSIKSRSDIHSLLMTIIQEGKKEKTALFTLLGENFFTQYQDYLPLSLQESLGQEPAQLLYSSSSRLVKTAFEQKKFSNTFHV